jgi:phosphoribosylglycinamide formyltransferase-1
VLISGGGTNLQALIDGEKKGQLKSGTIKLVVSDRPGAYGLIRAAENSIPAITVDRKSYSNTEELDKEIIKHLKAHNIQLVVLAGFLSILGPTMISAYKNQIINVHPSLIPSFCGEGFYGLKVHEAALKKGVKVTGATVHYVNEIPDGGEIIMQQPVLIKDDDTAKSLQERVMTEAEWVILPKAVEQVCQLLDPRPKQER